MAASFPDRGLSVLIVTTVTLVLSTILVAARLYCRAFIVRKVTWDDRVLILAWLFAVGLSIVINMGVRNGLGRRDEFIPDDSWDTLRHCEYAFSILYNPALMATKTSILIFYLRLSKNTQRILRGLSIACLALVILAGTVLTLLNIFQCRPISAAWSDSSSKEKCIPILTEFICSAPINFVTDLAILALPLPILTRMRLPLRQKVVLVFTFALGFFVTIVDVVRIDYLQQAVSAVPASWNSDANAKFGGPAEFSYNASLAFMWSAVEVNVGIFCACIPTLRPLVLKLLPAILNGPSGGPISVHNASFGVSPPESPSPRAISARAPVHGSVSSAVRSRQNTHDTRRPGSTSTLRTLSFDPDLDVAPEAIDQQVDRQARNHDADRADEVEGRDAVDDGPDDGPDGDTNDQEITLFEFLASGPPSTEDGLDKARGYDNRRAPTALSRAPPRRSSRKNAVYFGFVNLARPKSLVSTSAMESFKYCTVVTVLFLLWGLTYGLLIALNDEVAAISNMDKLQTLGLTAIYFGGGYFFGPLLVGEWILRRDEHYRIKRKKGSEIDSVGGFKVTFIVGLCIYGIGTIIFWPSAVTQSFGGFMLSNAVVGFGVAVLETGGNAFLILCGPPEYGEMRELLAQGVQSVGAVISALVAYKVFFNGIAAKGLINVEWTYLAITLVCFGLALLFYYLPLPETSDQELEELAHWARVDPKKRSIGGLQVRTWSLMLAVLAQYTYVAAQESSNIYFRSLIVSGLPGAITTGSAAIDNQVYSSSLDQPAGLTLSATDFLLIAQSAFALSRFLTGGLAYLAVARPHMPQPRTMLTVCVTFSSLFALLTSLVRVTDPNVCSVPLVLFYFFEGPISPLVYSIGLRGQGLRTKRAAAFLTMAGSGPAFAPFIMYAIVTNGGTIQHAFIVVAVLQLLSLVYPVFLESVHDASMLVDPRKFVGFEVSKEAESHSDSHSHSLSHLHSPSHTHTISQSHSQSLQQSLSGFPSDSQIHVDLP